MYCRVLACDFDGTTAREGRLAPEVAAALARARAQGILTMLVTGRLLEEVQARCPDERIFDAIVAENGAVICFPGREPTIEIGNPAPAEFLADLRRRHVPFHAGSVILGTWESHLGDLVDLLRRHAIDVQIIFNRSALMLVPTGVNKATGVLRALDEFGRSQHNLIAIGDAENDLPMLDLAVVGVAAHGSVATVEAAADVRLRTEGAAGVARYIHHILDADGRVETPLRKAVTLGSDLAGEAVLAPVSGSNVLVSGDPRSGKSWLAGWYAEQLLAEDLQLCIFDPEGDYGCLGDRPRVVVFGSGGVPLPDPAALPRLLRDAALSLVLDLTQIPTYAQVEYVANALLHLDAYRAQCGLPHWVVIDEAHNFFHEGAVANRYLATHTGDFMLVTYRPSLLSAEACGRISTWLIKQTANDEERYFLTRLWQERGPQDIVAAEAIGAVHAPHAGMLQGAGPSAQWRLFTPGRRVTVHAHHAHKYVDVQLPAEQAFRFLVTGRSESPAARNVSEFHALLTTVPRRSLRHHLTAGDFSRWALEILGDRHLASGLRKLERTASVGGTVQREELLGCVEDAYGLHAAPSR